MKTIQEVEMRHCTLVSIKPGSHYDEQGVTASYVKLRIAILNLPPIIVCCRQLSLTNPVATADGRNYPSRSLANFQHVENLVTAKKIVVISLETAALISLTFPCRARPSLVVLRSSQFRW